MNKLHDFVKYMKEDGKHLDFQFDGDVLYGLDKDREGGVYYEYSPYSDERIGFINYIGVDTERGLKVRAIREKDRDSSKKWGGESNIPDDLTGLCYELELWFQSYRSYFESMDKVKEYINSLDIVNLATASIENTKILIEKASKNLEKFKKSL